ncbi:general secretion pathway protein GspB [Pseudidiomarina taiwanensis]|uniref:Type II secretion system protein GspB C-terminal domain-containing protein n=1 Tax=Pseudidiomarina taiwanensis TaxID=337250 RepID=A0A432ZM74_9GAMM|nr:general secretion pathway protein GspB [Pseudidiomarina taiwanensis]RUO78979.1 hypothetical protein CWI83_00180 [Pseudidiomarina taiwanensis]
MSSVLKALQKNSAPKLHFGQPLELTAASERKGKSWRLVLGIVIFTLVASVTAWLVMSMQPEPQHVIEPQLTQVVASNAELELGPVTQIIVPTWPTDQQGQRLNPSREIISTGKATGAPEPVNLDQVSPELLANFEEALAASGEAQVPATVIPSLAELSRPLQRQIASFKYDSHQYSSRQASRWIELSGVRLREGEQWQGLQVIRIAPAHVVLSFGNRAFQQPALEDWTNPG